MTRHAFRLASVAFALSVFGVGLEVVRRRPPLLEMDRRRPESIWVADSTLGYRNRPNYAWQMPSLYSSTARFGEWGRRLGAREPVDLAGVNVAFAGDSTTVGIEVDDGHTISSEVERLMPVWSVNLGVRGYSTVQARLLTREWLHRLPRLRVVVYTFCANDLVENLDPTMLPGRPPGPTATLCSFDHVAPDGEPLFPAVLAWAAKHPRSDTRSDREAIRWAVDHDGVEVLRLILCGWNKELHERGVTLLVSRATNERGGLGAGEIARACRDAGVFYVDPGPAFTLPARDYETVLATGAHDPHWNELGTATYARAIASEITRRLK